MVHVYRFVLSNEKYVMNKVKGGISRAWFIACYLTLKESIGWNRGVLLHVFPPKNPIISQTTGRSKNSDSKRNKYGAPSKTHMLNVKSDGLGRCFSLVHFGAFFVEVF